jgi:hypothetical protein
MGRRALIELGHIVAGLAVGLGLTSLAAWSYPLGYHVIWACGAAAMLATLLMGIRPLARAIDADRGAR